MLTFSNTDNTSTGTPTALNQRLVVNGNNGAYVLWCATARDLTLNSGNVGSVAQQAVRTSTTCYLRGLSENLRLATSTDKPWLWRRICFTYRGTGFRNIASGDTPTTPYTVFSETSVGISRLMLNQTVNAMGNTTSAQWGVIFKGAQDVDWRDPIIAPLDNTRIDVKSDTTTRIFSGNSSGTLREVKRWYPMNKNLVYDDDESGDVMTPQNFSVVDKRGMGDYYVADIFVCTGGTTSDFLTLSASSTLYWHEK